MVHFVPDHASLEARGLHHALLALLVERAHAQVDRALHVHRDARDREAALLAGLAVAALPLHLGVGERDQGRVGADAVDEQPLRDAELRRREPHAEGVVHDPGHPAYLPAERIVEAIDRGGARLQHGVAKAADEGHRGGAPGLHLGVERRRLAGLVLLHLGLDLAERRAAVGLRVLQGAVPLLGHRGRV